MSTRAHGQQLSVRKRGGVTRYAIRFVIAGRRYYLALGTDREDGAGSGRDCFHLGLAERVLVALGAGFVAGDDRGQRGRKER